jgi:hypothetical protein
MPTNRLERRATGAVGKVGWAEDDRGKLFDRVS